MEVISLNVAAPRPINPDDPSSDLSGIYKLPVAGPVKVGALGLAGDAICAAEHHGGPDQAVYLYGIPDYKWWSAELARPLEPGLFGENLSLSGLRSTEARVGDRLQVGEAVLEVTGPRIPCGNFGTRMRDSTFPKRFRKAERPGVYCRVVQEGIVRAGDAVRYIPYEGETVTVVELFRDFFEPELTETAIRRFLAAPIAIRARNHKQAQLKRLLEK